MKILESFTLNIFSFINFNAKCEFTSYRKRSVARRLYFIVPGTKIIPHILVITIFYNSTITVSCYNLNNTFYRAAYILIKYEILNINI